MEMKDFLVAARKKTWASGSGKQSSARAGSEGRFIFEKEGWRYEDEFFGGRRFQGEEIVYENNRPVWGMVYHGGIPGQAGEVNPEEEFEFLKQALVTHSDRARFPGKVNFSEGNRTYLSDFIGSIDWFLGRELVRLKGMITHEVFFTAGKIEK